MKTKHAHVAWKLKLSLRLAVVEEVVVVQLLQVVLPAALQNAVFRETVAQRVVVVAEADNCFSRFLN
jgi:hypothetical protein